MAEPKDILSRIRETEPPSPSALRLLEVVADEKHHARDLTRIIEYDTALTAQVLRVVNSAAFRLLEPVDSLHRAVAYLGDSMIVGIALGSLAPHLYNQPLIGYDSAAGELWNHSLKTAIAAREVAERSRRSVSPEIAFTAGILHDIGKFVLSGFLSGMHGEMTARVDRGEVKDYLEAEIDAVGLDHGMVGGEMAEQWHLPPNLAAAIRYHHAPMKAMEDYRHLVFTVHLGDIVSMMSGTGTGADAMAYQLDPRFSEYVDIDRSDIEPLFMAVLTEFERHRTSVFGKKQEDA